LNQTEAQPRFAALTPTAEPPRPPAPGRGARILVVDAEPLGRRALVRELERGGARAFEADGAGAACVLAREETLELAVVATRLAGETDGLTLIEALAKGEPPLGSIALTRRPGDAAAALRAGALWALERCHALEPGALFELVRTVLARIETAPVGAASSEDCRTQIVGRSRALREVLAAVERVAPSDSTVLITGESGVGKELIARAIHERSRRRESAFVAVNCGAIPDELLESELFGHVRGAFTHAIQDRPGRFARAAGGTLFLDEIGDMSLHLQVKLLRVLQDGCYEPVGSSTTVQGDARVIAATHQDLESAVHDRRFRQDLFYRLNVIPIRVPSLRERPEDIPLLMDHFLLRAAGRSERPPPVLTAAARERLARYPWPGNTRELENLMHRLVVLHAGTTLDAEDLPAPFSEARPAPPIGELPDDLRFHDVVGRLETELLRRALERAGGNKTQAARLLGLNRTTLLEMLKKRGLS
jgi:DNA-binding NtrC family response regulator